MAAAEEAADEVVEVAEVAEVAIMKESYLSNPIGQLQKLVNPSLDSKARGPSTGAMHQQEVNVNQDDGLPTNPLYAKVEEEDEDDKAKRLSLRLSNLKSHDLNKKFGLSKHESVKKMKMMKISAMNDSSGPGLDGLW